MTDDLFDVERRSDDPAGAKAASEEQVKDAIVLRVHVQPGAGRAAVAGRHGDALHLRVAPPPADGRANDAVVALVADVLDVGRGSVEIVGGHKSRQKRVRVVGVDVDSVRASLERALDGAASPAGSARVRGGRGRH